MKPNQTQLAFIIGAFLLVFIASCAKKNSAVPAGEASPAAASTADVKQPFPAQLPVRFQKPSYLIQGNEEQDNLADSGEYEIKVGANITSTKGPQPLWDILKRLANLKGMSVSWASDVDQNVLVDVDISADDNFFDAIDNLLRQVDYYHVVKDNAIIVKYRETRRFQISIPNMKGSYKTNVGGNFLTGREAAKGTEGTVQVTSDDNKFDLWKNIATNLDTIMQEWRTTQTEQNQTITKKETTGDTGETGKTEGQVNQATRRIALGNSYYTIDNSVGLITVTAPRPLLNKVAFYLQKLKKELYRQVIIEAKIIEVSLKDNSRIGIDWSKVLQDFTINGTVDFGDSGQVWPWVPATGDGESPTRFVTKVSLESKGFSAMLNALNEQGNTKVLSNPKLTVLNGQPAVLSVGKDITYIKKVSSSISGTTATTVTYTVETDSVVEGISLGVMASIVDNNTVILHLTPITTNLLEDPIYNETIGGGDNAIKIGLPKVRVREMSTMVQVRSGEMLIIGGLIDQVKNNNSKFAPVIGNIPILKYLFGVKDKQLQRRELVILLTPRII